jgi:Flp pilus assembly pilin Flp
VLLLLHLFVALQTRLLPRQPRDERGQATTEYVLVLLGVAAIAIAVVTWATKTGKVGELLDKVFDHVEGQIS